MSLYEKVRRSAEQYNERKRSEALWYAACIAAMKGF